MQLVLVVYLGVHIEIASHELSSHKPYSVYLKERLVLCQFGRVDLCRIELYRVRTCPTESSAVKSETINPGVVD